MAPKTLTETREKLARSGSNLTYDKRYLRLTDEEVARRVRAGEKSTIRLNDGNAYIRPSYFPGTVIRFPLRSSPSELGQRVMLVQEPNRMIRDYITKN
ncbi:hypothetical protein F5887DRAFT_1081418 [Amanita rubescens]|nr:hypothetical protein F5887DRAFT_1081418 [Amanita rubescens]